MKFLKKFLLVSFITGAALSVAVAVFVGMVLSWPGMVVNPTVLKWAKPLAWRYGYEVDWGSADVKAASLSPLHQRYDLAFSDLCVASRDKLKSGCFRTLTVSFEIAWDGGLKFPAFGPLSAAGGTATLSFPPSEAPETRPAEAPKLKIPKIVLPGPFRQTRFQPVVIDVQRLAVITEEKIRAGGLLLSTLPDPFEHLGTVVLQADLFEGFGLESLSASARVSSPSRFLENDWNLDVSADVVKTGVLSADAEAEIFPSGDGSYTVNVQATARIREGRYRLQTAAVLGSGNLEGKVTASAVGFTPEVQGAYARDCPYGFRETEAGSGRGRFRLDCPIKVDLSPFRLPSATMAKLVTVPYNLDLVAVAELETDLVPTPGSRVKGTLDVTLEPVSRELMDARGSAKTRFAGIPADFPKGWEATTDLNLSFGVKRFQNLVHALERSAFAVPAPVNALDGTLQVDLNGRTDLIRTRGTFPLKFATHLKSSNQDFDTDGKGELQLAFIKRGSKTAVDMELQLANVKLELPRFGLSSLPSLFMDGRIHVPEAMKKQVVSNFFEYHFKITTPKEPVRLVSELVEEGLPVFLDLDVTREKVSGTVKVGATNLRLFRRTARLEGLTVTLAQPPAASEVNGRVRAVYAEYKIDMWIQGTVAKPHVYFESVPPLAQDQMVAALLYGRPFGDLNSTQSSSVANTSQALTQNSVALGSLFLLAATPVENVNYNPDTGAFEAKVRLTDNTLLTVNTQEQKQQFGVRRNLSGNWVVNTYIENDNEKRKQTGVALFEWIKRY
ncbi:MAG TPA: translocation/assembly module TamB domain-containing protein [bacterium]|nr:translocation/assembly module TamB domain-containing protein [bacterium]